MDWKIIKTESQLDSVENEIYISEKCLRNKLWTVLREKNVKVTKIKQLKLGKQIINIVILQVNWIGKIIKLGVDYWQKQLNKKNKGIEKRTRNFHIMPINIKFSISV